MCSPVAFVRYNTIREEPLKAEFIKTEGDSAFTWLANLLRTWLAKETASTYKKTYFGKLAAFTATEVFEPEYSWCLRLKQNQLNKKMGLQPKYTTTKL